MIALFVIAATVNSLRCNRDEIAVSHSSVRRARIQHRRDINNEIRGLFIRGPILTVHWNGKLHPDITSSKMVERLPVIVTEKTTNKLLGLPSYHCHLERHRHRK